MGVVRELFLATSLSDALPSSMSTFRIEISFESSFNCCARQPTAIKAFTFVKAKRHITPEKVPLNEIMAKDPICGMTVDEKTAMFTSEHGGHTFYFCSASCKAAFDKDPHRYGHPT